MKVRKMKLITLNHDTTFNPDQIASVKIYKANKLADGKFGTLHIANTEGVVFNGPDHEAIMEVRFKKESALHPMFFVGETYDQMSIFHDAFILTLNGASLAPKSEEISAVKIDTIGFNGISEVKPIP